MTDAQPVQDAETAVDEFDTEAAWIAEVLEELPEAYAIPGACRGSGNPAILDWLSQALEIRADTRMLDLGGGLGGPAAWLRKRCGTEVVVAEPMVSALRGARNLFGLRVVAVGEPLPFSTGCFDAAWALAVLSTVSDPEATIQELHRVLAPGAGLGLCEYTRTGEVSEPPSGNAFLSPSELRNCLCGAGFEVLGEQDTSELADPPPNWQERADTVSRLLAERHGEDAPLKTSQRQAERFAAALEEGSLSVRVLHAVRR